MNPRNSTMGAPHTQSPSSATPATIKISKAGDDFLAMSRRSRGTGKSAESGSADRFSDGALAVIPSGGVPDRAGGSPLATADTEATKVRSQRGQGTVFPAASSGSSSDFEQCGHRKVAMVSSVSM